ncbi:methyltransferase [Olea europaea subsp. europaea]|uniref:Methyltransferase n=1 Tax=Olea europaea subsp. europaea TaxID=158383 RepID=A0A8S0TJ01_OLEEU|nr:methyltransferase [Olea europaea subsp. europaea]
MNKKKVANKAIDCVTFIEELLSLRFDDNNTNDDGDKNKNAIMPMLYSIDLLKQVDNAKERYGYLRRRIFGDESRHFKQWIESLLGVVDFISRFDDERWLYASRAWLKLDDICQQFPRLNLTTGVVVDLAADPGSFSEYVGKHFKNVERIIAVSLHGMTRLSNCRNVQCLLCDLQNTDATTNTIISNMNEREIVSLVLADGALDSTNSDGGENDAYSTEMYNFSLIQSEICVALSLLARSKSGGDFLLKTFGVKQTPTVQAIAQCATHFRRTLPTKLLSSQ